MVVGVNRPRRRQAAAPEPTTNSAGPDGDDVPSPDRSPSPSTAGEPAGPADTTSLTDEATHPKLLMPGCLLPLLAEQPDHGHTLAGRLGTFGSGWSREPVRVGDVVEVRGQIRAGDQRRPRGYMAGRPLRRLAHVEDGHLAGVET